MHNHVLSYTDIVGDAKWTAVLLSRNQESSYLRTLHSSSSSRRATSKAFHPTQTPLLPSVHPDSHRAPSRLLPMQRRGWLSTGQCPPRCSPLATREPYSLSCMCVPWPAPLTSPRRLSPCRGCPTTRISSSQAGRLVRTVSHRHPSLLTWNLRPRLQPMKTRKLKFNFSPKIFIPYLYLNHAFIPPKIFHLIPTQLQNLYFLTSSFP